MKAANGFTEEAVILLAGSLEAQSEHPLASAVASAIEDRKLAQKKVEGFVSTTGQGVSGRIDGKLVRVGQENWLTSSGIPLSRGWKEEAEKLRDQGKTVIFIPQYSAMAGCIEITDPIKTSTPKALEELQRLGLKIVVATGHNPKTAAAIAKKLNLTDVRAGIDPKGKRELVHALKQKGERVANVRRRGSTTPPALAEADIGIAMITGTDVAIESAALTLMKGELQSLVRTVHLSRATMRNIKQNLFFAFFYNSLGVPLALDILYPVFGWLFSPVIAGAAMNQAHRDQIIEPVFWPKPGYTPGLGLYFLTQLITCQPLAGLDRL